MAKNNNESTGSLNWRLSSSLVEKVKSALENPSIIHEIIDPMIDGIVILDGELGVFEANSSFCGMLGYTHEEILKLHVWDWDLKIPPDANKQMGININDARVHFVSNQKRKDGSFNTVEIQGLSFGYKDAMWQICLCRDINDHKKVESDLQKSQHNLYETQRIAHIGSWELDLETGVFMCSDEMKRIWGLREDQEENILEIMQYKTHPDDREELERAVQRSVNEGLPYDIEYRIIDENGNVSHLNSRSRITKNSQGRAVRLYGICQDITEQKKREEERLLNEKRLLQIQEIAHIGTYEYNLKTDELWWSDEAYRIFGISDKKEITLEKYLEYVHPDDADRLKALSEVGQEDYYVEYRIIRPDGEIRYISTFVGKHEYRDGERYLIRGTAQDITEQKLMEQERNQLESRLHHSQKMETIGTLAGGVAHDINNILGIIIGNTELCLDDVPEWNPAYANLQEVVKAVLRAKKVIRQLLTFSRNIDIKKEPIDIVSVVEDSLKFLRSTISATVTIEKQINITNPNIIADPTQIKQIILNICANSAQAMEAKGGLIKIKMENITVNHSQENEDDVLANGEYIKIVIMDDGPGIAPAIHDKIFDPYFTTKEVGKGSGMGLAVVQGIVKKHKGSINVKSKIGKGAIFTILLPGIDEARPKKNREDINTAFAGRRILFIDDEIQITSVATRMLETLGYVPESRTNPQEALELFKEKPGKYDLVITDMAMPRMNALMLFEEIRKIRSDIPIILSSGHNPLVDEKRAEETGFSAYILKPFTRAELAASIKSAFEKTEQKK